MFNWGVRQDKKAVNAIILGEGSEKGRPFKSRFLQAGLVKYDFGVCLLQKETIDKFIDTFKGCPVIINHKDSITESDKVGVVNNIWFSDKDGWYWCDGVLTDDKAVKLVESGYNVSCQYAIIDYSINNDGKLHNGNPYDKEILNGLFEHLAIVDNPRYEGAYIAVNAYIAQNAIARNEDLTINKYQPVFDWIRNFKGGTMDKETKGLFESLIEALKARNEADDDKEKEDDKKAENKKAKNEDVDKRKLIDEVAGIMKSAGADDELIRTAIAKMEKLAYDKSEAGTADNKAKNEDEEEGKDKDAENKCKNKCKNEDDGRKKEKEEKYEELKEEVKKEAENKKAKNSMDALKRVFFEGEAPRGKIYMSQKEGIELGRKLY